MECLVSIIVPVYNNEKYIGRCIESILQQTYQNYELILVNDGSKDNSLKICEEYSNNNPKIKIVNKKNGGLSSARNAGIEVAKGDWILFIDQDDWIDNDCVEKLVGRCDDETDIVVFPYIREYPANSKKVEIFEEDYRIFDKEEIDNCLIRKLVGPINEELKKPNRMEDLNPAWNKLYRTSVINDIRFIDGKEIGTEDLWFNLQVFSNAKHIIFSKTTYYHYDKTNDCSMTRTYNERLFPGWIKLYSLIDEYINEKFNDEKYGEALNNRRIINLLALTRNVVISSLPYKEKLYRLREILSHDSYSKAFNRFDFSDLGIVWRCYYKACSKKSVRIIYILMFVAERVKQFS